MKIFTLDEISCFEALGDEKKSLILCFALLLFMLQNARLSQVDYKICVRVFGAFVVLPKLRRITAKVTRLAVE